MARKKHTGRILILSGIALVFLVVRGCAEGRHDETAFPRLPDGYTPPQTLKDTKRSVAVPWGKDSASESLTVSNVSKKTVRVWLWREGSPNYHDLETFLASLVSPEDGELQKVLAVYRHFDAHMQHQIGKEYGGTRMDDPIVAFADDGYGMCWTARNVAANILASLSLRERCLNLDAHTTTEVLIDGRWCHVDFNQIVMLRDEDGRILGYEGILERVRDPSHPWHDGELVLKYLGKKRFRKHFLSPDGSPFPQPRESSAHRNKPYTSASGPSGETVSVRVKGQEHVMQYRLRPGESIALSAVPGGEFFGRGPDPVNKGLPAPYANGRFRYELDLAPIRKALEAEREVDEPDAGIRAYRVDAFDYYLINVTSPYTLLDAEVSLEGEAAGRVWYNKVRSTVFELNNYRTDWRIVGDLREGGAVSLRERLNSKYSKTVVYPHYDFWLKVRLSKRSRAQKIVVKSLFQCAAKAVTRLEPGQNTINVYGSHAAGSGWTVTAQEDGGRAANDGTLNLSFR